MPNQAGAVVCPEDVELVWVDEGDGSKLNTRRGTEEVVVEVGGKVFLVVVVVEVTIRVK